MNTTALAFIASFDHFWNKLYLKEWTFKDVEEVKVTCKNTLKDLPQLVTFFKKDEDQKSLFKHPTIVIFPCLHLFCVTAKHCKNQKDDSLYTIGYLDMVELLSLTLKELLMLCLPLKNIKQKGKLFCLLNDTSICLLMMIEVSIIYSKESLLISLLSLLETFFEFFKCKKDTIMVPLSQTQTENENSSNCLVGIIIQCLTRILCHVVGHPLFFDNLHVKESENKIQHGKKLIGKKSIFLKSSIVLDEIISIYCSPILKRLRKLYISNEFVTHSNDDNNNSLKLDIKYHIFITSIAPGILSCISNFLFKKIPLKYDVLNEYIAIMKNIILTTIPDALFYESISTENIYLKYLHQYDKSKNIGPRKSRGNYFILMLSMAILSDQYIYMEPKMSHIPHQINSDFFINTTKVLTLCLKVLLSENASFVSEYCIENEDQSKIKLESLPEKKILKSPPIILSSLCIDIIDYCSYTLLISVSNDIDDISDAKSQLCELLLECLVAGYFPLNLIHNRFRKNNYVEKLMLRIQAFKSYFWIMNTLSQKFYDFLTNLIPHEVTSILNSKTMVSEVSVRLLGFLIFFFDVNKQPLMGFNQYLNLKDMICLIIRLFQVDWKLSYYSMIDTTCTYLSNSLSWFDEIPKDTIFLYNPLLSGYLPYQNLKSIFDYYSKEFELIDPALEPLDKQSKDITINDSFNCNENYLLDLSVIVEAVESCLVLLFDDKESGSSFLAKIGKELLSLTGPVLCLEAFMDFLVLSLPEKSFQNFDFQNSNYVAMNSNKLLNTVKDSQSPICDMTILLNHISMMMTVIFIFKKKSIKDYIDELIPNENFSLETIKKYYHSIESLIRLILEFLDYITSPFNELSLSSEGIWIENPDVFYNSLSINQNESNNQKKFNVLTCKQRISITNLMDTVLMLTLYTFICYVDLPYMYSLKLKIANIIPKKDNANNLFNFESASISFDNENILIKFHSIINNFISSVSVILESRSYDVLKKVAYPYRVPSSMAYLLLTKINSLLTSNTESSSSISEETYSENFLTNLSASVMDSILLDLYNDTGYRNETSPWNNSKGDALLAAVSMGTNQSILLMNDILAHLIKKIFPRNPECIINGLSSNSLFLKQTSMVFAGIAKRLCITYRENPSYNSSYSWIYEDYKKTYNIYINKYNKEYDLLQKSIKYLKTIRKHYGNDQQSNISYPDQSHFFSCSTDILNYEDNYNVTNSNDNTLPPSFYLTNTMLINVSTQLFFHSQLEVQFYAHLTCFYSIHCTSVSREYCLPYIHQIWPVLKSSLSRSLPSKRGLTNISVSVLLVGSLLLRYMIHISYNFLISRFQEELFPIICKILEKDIPAVESDISSRPSLLRIQMVLMDILITASTNVEFIRPVVDKCLALSVRFWNSDTALKLRKRSYELAMRCILSHPEKSVLSIASFAVLIIHYDNEVTPIRIDSANLKQTIQILLNFILTSPMSQQDATNILFSKPGFKKSDFTSNSQSVSLNIINDDINIKTNTQLYSKINFNDVQSKDIKMKAFYSFDKFGLILKVILSSILVYNYRYNLNLELNDISKWIPLPDLLSVQKMYFNIPFTLYR